ncbi:SpoIIE family protein phosphatase [Streptomyces sulfonofaciens]|nr:SpoIIE family protein phosphatase [Streptomyces sulfonofaciens]
MACKLGSATGTGRVASGFAHSAPGVPAPALALIDSDGTVLEWGDGARLLLGHRAQDVVGRSVRRILAHPADLAPRSAPLRPSATGAAPAGSSPLASPGRRDRRQYASTVVAVRHRDGRVLRLNVDVVPLTRAGDERCWFVAATGLPDGAGPGGGQAALLDRSALAVAVWDTRLRLVWANRAAKEAVGLPGSGGSVPPTRRILRGFDRTTTEPVMRDVLDSGEAIVDHLVRWVSPEDGREAVFSSCLFPLARREGGPLGVCTVSLDITRTWERERLALLGRAAQRIGTTLDVTTTAQELADTAVPALADYATVDLAEAVPLGQEPLERMAAGEAGIPVFRRAGMTSVHEGVPEAAFQVGDVVYVPPGSPFLTVLGGTRSYLEPVMETGPGTWLDRDATRRRLIQETGMHSLMMVPLRARGTILGIAVFARTENAVPFSRDDLLLAEELAVQASLSLDNARRYTRERTAALALQRSLLPGELSGGGAVDLATRYLPTDRHEGVGGDWVDAIPLPGARVALVIGDVVGHGIHAAATMGRLRTAVHTLAALDQPPAELLAHLDEVTASLAQSGTWSTGSPPIVGASCLYAVYDPVGGVCTLARAGHPPPLLVAPDGRVAMPATPVGPPIGTGIGGYECVDLELPEGTLIVLYTDGLIEARHIDIDVGLDRLAGALRNPPAALDELCTRVVTRMRAQAPQEDDVALLVARTRAGRQGGKPFG